MSSEPIRAYLHGHAGVDYTHPDLGGCFGSGCRIAYGYNFIEDNDDPRDTCIGAKLKSATVLPLPSLDGGEAAAVWSVTCAQYAKYLALQQPWILC